MSSSVPNPPEAPELPTATTRVPTGGRRTRAWLIACVLLAATFVVSAIAMILVALPPSYEPVPVPSVSRT